MPVDEGLLHAWLDGQLGPEDAARVEALVASDDAWAAAAAEARGLLAASSRILGALDDTPSARHAVAVPRMTARGLGGVGLGGRRIAPWWRAAAGLVLAVGLGAVVWESRQGEWGDPQVPPATEAARVGDSVPPPSIVPAPGSPTTATSAVTEAAVPPAADRALEARIAARRVAEQTVDTRASAEAMAKVTPPIAEQQAVAQRAAPPTAPPVADFGGRGVAGGTVAGVSGGRGVAPAAALALTAAPSAREQCVAPIDSMGVIDTTQRARLTSLESRADSTVRAEWVERAGRAVLEGRLIGDTLRGAVRISAGDIRLPMQPRVLLRVPCG